MTSPRLPSQSLDLNPALPGPEQFETAWKGCGRRAPTRIDPHTLGVASVTPLQPSPGLASSALLINLALESLDLAPQVRDDAGVLGNVVGDIEQVLLHLWGAQGGGRAGTVTPGTRAACWVFLSLSPPPNLQSFWLTVMALLPAPQPVTLHASDRAMLLKCFSCSTFGGSPLLGGGA